MKGYTNWVDLKKRGLAGWLLRTTECGMNMRSLVKGFSEVGGDIHLEIEWTEMWIPAKGDEPGRWQRQEKPAKYEFGENQLTCFEEENGVYWIQVQLLLRGNLYPPGKYTLGTKN